MHIMTEIEAAKFGYFANHNFLKITPFWWHPKIASLSFCCREIYVNVMESTNIEMAPVKLYRCNKRYKVKLRRRLLRTNPERSSFLVACFFCSLSLIYTAVLNCNYVDYVLPTPQPCSQGLFPILSAGRPALKIGKRPWARGCPIPLPLTG